MRTETGKDKDDREAECGDQFSSGDVARRVTDKTHDRSDNTAANNGHNDEGRTVFGVLAEILNAQREDCWVLNRHKGATQLLVEFQSLEGIYENLDAVAEKWRKKLETHKEMAFLCRDIARLQTDLHIDGNLQQLRLVR